METAVIEFEAFVSAVKLPEGFRWKEREGAMLTPAPASYGSYYDSVTAAIEKIEDGSLSSFELSRLPIHPGRICIPVGELGKCVERALLILQGRTIPNTRYKGIEFSAATTKEKYEREMDGFEGYSYEDARKMFDEREDQSKPFWFVAKSYA